MNGCYDATVVVGAQIGWIMFGKRVELLYEGFSLNIRGAL